MTTTTTFKSIRCIRCRISWAFDRDGMAAASEHDARFAAEPKGIRHRASRHDVTGTRRDEIKCGGKCLVAYGPDCECSCGGEHHGRYAA